MNNIFVSTSDAYSPQPFDNRTIRLFTFCHLFPASDLTANPIHMCILLVKYVMYFKETTKFLTISSHFHTFKRSVSKSNISV